MAAPKVAMEIATHARTSEMNSVTSFPFHAYKNHTTQGPLNNIAVAYQDIQMSIQCKQK